MSRARLHELRALKRRILRAEAGGTPDLASRRAFNAELRASRLALRAGGKENKLQGKLKIKPSLRGQVQDDPIVMNEVDLKEGEIVAVNTKEHVEITVENLKKALIKAKAKAKAKANNINPQMQITEQDYLEASLSQKQPSDLELSLSLGSRNYDEGYHSYQIYITKTRDCSVNIRFMILHKLRSDIKKLIKEQLPALKKRWGPLKEWDRREKEIREFLKKLNSIIMTRTNNDISSKVRSEVIDTIVQHTCKISLGECPLGGDMVTFMYDDQSTTSEGPVVLTLKEHKINILASKSELQQIQEHELHETVYKRKLRKIHELHETVYGKIIKDGEILKVEIGNSGDKLPLYRARKLNVEYTPESVILGSTIQNPNEQISLFKRNEPYFAYDVNTQKYSKQIQNERETTDSVNLLKKDLGDRAAAEVVAEAKQHGNIKTLCGIEEGQTEVDLKPRTIDDILKAPDAVLLSFDLEFNRALKSADFSDNSIGDEGTAALSDVLKSNSTLETLELRHNKVGAAGAQSLAGMLQVNSSLKSLDLCHNDLGEASETIAQAVLQHPTMEVFCTIPMKKMRKDSLTELDLHVKGIGPPGAMVIAPLLQFSRSLKSAKLGINDIGDRGTTALSDALKTNSTLEELDLGYNMIGVAGARSLADMLGVNRALISANLANNDIGDEGAIAISAALKTNSTLTSINLGGNSIKEGKSLADMLGVNRALNSVHLGNNSIGDEGTEEICKALKSNNKPYNSTLEELELAGNEIGAAGARSLAEMLQFNGALTTLDLGNNDIGVPDRWSIKKEKNEVTFKHEDGRTRNDCPPGTSSGVSALAESLKVNSSLKSADLSSNHIGDDGISNLCDALKENNSLESLTIENPLYYLDTQIGAVGAKSLADMLKVNRSLTSAKLGGNSFGDEGTEALSDALKTNSTLKILKLTDNKITAAGAQSLAEMLQVNGALTSVDLMLNYEMTVEGEKKLRDAVEGKEITLKL